MTIAEKYRKILEKPMPEPFKAYIEELVAHIEANETSGNVLSKPKKSKPLYDLDANEDRRDSDSYDR